MKTTTDHDITLRDRFAMAALVDHVIERMTPNQAAEYAYKIADAMLEARKPKEEPNYGHRPFLKTEPKVPTPDTLESKVWYDVHRGAWAGTVHVTPKIREPDAFFKFFSREFDVELSTEEGAIKHIEKLAVEAWQEAWKEAHHD